MKANDVNIDNMWLSDNKMTATLILNSPLRYGDFKCELSEMIDGLQHLNNKPLRVIRGKWIESTNKFVYIVRIDSVLYNKIHRRYRCCVIF